MQGARPNIAMVCTHYCKKYTVLCKVPSAAILLIVNEQGGTERNAAECVICAARLKAEVFRRVIVANIFHNFAQAGKLFRRVLSAFDKPSEHLAKYSSVIFVTGIREKRAAVREHTDGLRNQTDLH